LSQKHVTILDTPLDGCSRTHSVVYLSQGLSSLLSTFGQRIITMNHQSR